MKATDWRIGNWFIAGGKDYLVTSVNWKTLSGIHYTQFKGAFPHGIAMLQGGESKSIKYKNVEPIPLSPSWLERAGFEKKNEFWVPKSNIFSYFKIRENRDNSFSLALKEGNKLIPFVHKLQNIFYELQDEELTFNL